MKKILFIAMIACAFMACNENVVADYNHVEY